MYGTYILYSEKCKRLYTGYGANLNTRLQRRYAGMVTATKTCRPYILKAFKEFKTEKEARAEELRLKGKEQSLSRNAN